MNLNRNVNGQKSLETLRAELLEKREVLARDLRETTAEMIDDEPSYSDPVDQASADTDKATVVELKNRGRGILGEIDAAIRRIDSGTFGTCERCDEQIAAERLRANPYTTLCIECKAELESEGGRFPRRA